MSTHDIGFYEEMLKNYLSVSIKYNQICTVFVLLNIFCFLENIWTEIKRLLNRKLTIILI